MTVVGGQGEVGIYPIIRPGLQGGGECGETWRGSCLSRRMDLKGAALTVWNKGIHDLIHIISINIY